MPSAKRKSDKTQIGLFIGGEVFHFGGDYDIIKTKICTRQYRIILSAAAAGTVLKPSGGNCAVLPKGFAAPSAKKLTSINIPTFS